MNWGRRDARTISAIWGERQISGYQDGIREPPPLLNKVSVEPKVLLACLTLLSFLLLGFHFYSSLRLRLFDVQGMLSCIAGLPTLFSLAHRNHSASTMTPYFGLTGAWLTFWVTVACATDMTLFGYDQGVFGGVIVTQDFLDTLGLNGNTSLVGTVTAVYDIGMSFLLSSTSCVRDSEKQKLTFNSA